MPARTAAFTHTLGGQEPAGKQPEPQQRQDPQQPEDPGGLQRSRQERRGQDDDRDLQRVLAQPSSAMVDDGEHHDRLRASSHRTGVDALFEASDPTAPRPAPV